jgi:SAM-dependent methyltransferase
MSTSALPFEFRPSGSYSNREERARYIGETYAGLLTGRVLDVGCFRRDLKKFVKGEYVGVDLYGEPDISLDLEGGKLPFADRSFDTVVCTDVLEHIEQIHAIFDEMLRVSRKWVLVSLPNNRQGEWRRMLQSNPPKDKYYGLPVDRPLDRHRWYFGATEAEHFVAQRAPRCGGKLVHVHDVNSAAAWKRAIASVIMPNPASRRDALVAVSWYVVEVSAA